MAETQQALRSLGVVPQRRRGQNFMVDPQELRCIVEAAAPRPGERIVEIGPGLGFLTRALLDSGASVLAIEKDRNFSRRLASRWASLPLRVVEADVLEVDLARELGRLEPVQVVGNIPYNITSPIIEWLLAQRVLVRRAFLTVQWEVAERICSVPGNKVWGPLSIFVQYRARPSILRKVHRRCFYPSPKVDSALLSIDLSETAPWGVRDEQWLFRLIRRSFQKRRKTLLNSLEDPSEPRLERVNLARVLREIAFDPARRPETLSIEEWVLLSNSL